MTTYYCGARIFNDGNLLEDFALAVKNGKTTHILPQKEIPEQSACKTLSGGILTPGFVETQANGGGGVLINEGYAAAGLKTVLAAHRRFGTVAMLPTFITDSKEKYHAAIDSIAQGVRDGIAGLIGGHFEGPFLNAEKKGTHNPQYLRQPDEEDFACYERNAEYLRHSILSLAPECVPAGTIARIKATFPCIQMAHSMATHEDLQRAYGEGLTGVTHLYNAMRPMQGRDPGPIGSAAELGLACGIIADGIHSHPFALANAYRSIGADRLILVTDSMHTIGAPEIDEFMLMGVKVFVESDRLVNEFGSLAGAHITQLQCVKNAVRFMHADIRSALKMAVSTPARYVRRADLAQIVAREAKDILWLDDALNLAPWR